MADQHDVAFNIPYTTGRERTLIDDAIVRGQFSGDGHYTRRCHELIEAITTSPLVLLTTSCTHALDMSAMLLDLREGDEVIMPSFTFVSTANAFALRGAIPVFVDIRGDTLNIDETLIEAAITPRTRAIVVVHYAGVACEMDEIMAIADAHGLAVIEDAAHALGGTYRGRGLGAIGALGTLSFHATKNVQCGEGGALLVNDPSMRERAEIIREKGTNRSRFLRGEIDRYTWVDVGSSFLPAEVLAAFLVAQLEAFDHIQARRTAIWNRYAHGLRDWAASNGVRVPVDLDDREHTAHQFAVGLRDLAERQRFIDHMAAGGIKSVFHYVPLHSAPVGRRYAPDLSLPVTDAVSDGLARLPLYPGLDQHQQDRVIERVLRFTVDR
jgi:dTDP-4-amino-4,6-dideoxygalactose transaminase